MYQQTLAAAYWSHLAPTTATPSESRDPSPYLCWRGRLHGSSRDGGSSLCDRDLCWGSQGRAGSTGDIRRRDSWTNPCLIRLVSRSLFGSLILLNGEVPIRILWRVTSILWGLRVGMSALSDRFCVLELTSNRTVSLSSDWPLESMPACTSYYRSIHWEMLPHPR